MLKRSAFGNVTLAHVLMQHVHGGRRREHVWVRSAGNVLVDHRVGVVAESCGDTRGRGEMFSSRLIFTETSG